jgi:hypothetical protein
MKKRRYASTRLHGITSQKTAFRKLVPSLSSGDKIKQEFIIRWAPLGMLIAKSGFWRIKQNYPQILGTWGNIKGLLYTIRLPFTSLHLSFLYQDCMAPAACIPLPGWYAICLRSEYVLSRIRLVVFNFTGIWKFNIFSCAYFIDDMDKISTTITIPIGKCACFIPETIQWVSMRQMRIWIKIRSKISFWVASAQ